MTVSAQVNRQSEPPKEAEARVCVRCVMDTSDPEIQFDDGGVCNHCRRYFALIKRYPPAGLERDRALASLVDEIKSAGRRKDYDCVIGVSGGVDSTSVAYHVKQLGLRPIALHLDNGWNSELAVDNIRRTLDVLGIDLLTHVIDWGEFRDIQLSFVRAGVPNWEIPTDHAINAYLMSKASELGVKYVLQGTNVATEGILPFSWTYNSLDYKHLKAIHRRFGKIRIRTFPTLSLQRFAWVTIVRGTRFIPILNYIEYGRESAKKLITEELGWRDYGGKHFESTYTKFYQSYVLPVKFGFDKRRAHLSALVCGGELSRDQALSQLAQSPFDPETLAEEMEYVVKKLGIDGAEFDAILAEPPRRHQDYPGYHHLFSPQTPLRSLYRRFVSKG